MALSVGKLKPFRGFKENVAPVLLERGEIFFEYNENGPGAGPGKIKMGDGVHTIADLPYFMGNEISDQVVEFVEPSYNINDLDDGDDKTDIPAIASGNKIGSLIAKIKKVLINHSKAIKGLRNTKVSKSGDTINGSLEVTGSIDTHYLTSTGWLKTEKLITTANDYYSAIEPSRAGNGSIGSYAAPYRFLHAGHLYVGESTAAGAPENIRGSINIWNGGNTWSTIYADSSVNRSVSFVLPADDYEDGGYIATRKWVTLACTNFVKLNFGANVGTGFVLRIGNFVLIHMASEGFLSVYDTITTIPPGFRPDSTFTDHVYCFQTSGMAYYRTAILISQYGEVEAWSAGLSGQWTYTGIYLSTMFS